MITIVEEKKEQEIKLSVPEQMIFDDLSHYQSKFRIVMEVSVDQREDKVKVKKVSSWVVE